jgi:hypothetical protein
LREIEYIWLKEYFDKGYLFVTDWFELISLKDDWLADLSHRPATELINPSQWVIKL